MTDFDSNEYNSDLIAGSHSISISGGTETDIKKEVAGDVELRNKGQNLIFGCFEFVNVENLEDETNGSSALNRCFDIDNNEQMTMKFDNTSSQVGFYENHTECVAPKVMKCKEEVEGLYECKLCELKTSDKDVFLRHFKIIHKAEERLLAGKEKVVKSECLSNEIGCNGYNEDYNVKYQENSKEEEEEVNPGDTKINLQAKNSAACSDGVEFVIPLKNSKEYECKLCGLKTKYADVFLRHFKIIHTDKKNSFQCKFCEQKFETRHNLRGHVIQKHSETINKCPSCEYQSRWRSALQNHIRYKHVHYTEQLKCELCSYTTKYKYYLKQHFQFAHDENAQLYICAFCEFKTKRKSSLKKHFRCKHTSVDFHCQFCGLKTKYKQYLMKHLRKFHGKQIGSDSSSNQHSES